MPIGIYKHKIHQGFKKGYTPYNKGTHITNSGCFKKGVNISPKTQFKKGENIGDNHPRWKGGKERFKCIDCKKQISFGRIRCRKCNGIKNSGECNYFYGKVGVLSQNWKSGVTTENERQRRTKKYQKLRRNCIERDNFTCQKYGTSGGELFAHHINNFADFPELRFELDNLITLSRKAHQEFHSIYGNKNNTREQLNEFLTQ